MVPGTFEVAPIMAVTPFKSHATAASKSKGTDRSYDALDREVDSKRNKMKKIVIIAVALTFALSTATMAQSTSGSGASGDGAGSVSGNKASPGAPNGSPAGNEKGGSAQSE
jgi:hypothetical protein